MEQIQTVLKNLLANALKCSNAENSPVGISINRTDSWTHIEIQDHGQVIPEEAGLALDLIFETFYRNDKSRNKKTGGYGLGLILCKTIIEVHGGTISVKSKFWRRCNLLFEFTKFSSTYLTESITCGKNYLI